MLLSAVPDTHGRPADGVRASSSGQAAPTATAAPVNAATWPMAARSPRGAIQRYAATMPGTTISATAILVSKPRPTATPLSTSQRVRPSSSARTQNHTAATEHSTSSASGLLWRETATAIGVSASTSPATVPAARPNGAPDQVVDQGDRGGAHQRLRDQQAPGAVAEHLDRGHLDPGGQRRLVHGHHARGIERSVDERVPARAHRPHRGGVVLVGEAVAVQAPEVQHQGQHDQGDEFGAGDGGGHAGHGQGGTAELECAHGGHRGPAS